MRRKQPRKIAGRFNIVYIESRGDPEEIRQECVALSCIELEIRQDIRSMGLAGHVCVVIDLRQNRMSHPPEILYCGFQLMNFITYRKWTWTLHHAATQCNSLQITAVDFVGLCGFRIKVMTHYTATHCNLLQLTATQCSGLCAALWISNQGNDTQRCNILQLAATCCNVLQRAATCCNPVQRTLWGFVDLKWML